MKKILIATCILVLVVVLGLGYLGFIPAISKVLGSDQPRNLGINPRLEDLDNAKTKFTAVNFDLAERFASEAVGQAMPVTGRSVAVRTSFSSQEVTAMLKTGNWNTWPVMDTQVRINPDGSAEASGTLLIGLVTNFAGRAGYSRNDVQKALDILHVKSNIPFYVKGTGSITNNQVSINVQKAELGRLPVPGVLINQHQGDVNGFVQNGISRMPDVKINSLKAENGQVTFDGKLPAYCPHW